MHASRFRRRFASVSTAPMRADHVRQLHHHHRTHLAVLTSSRPLAHRFRQHGVRPRLLWHLSSTTSSPSSRSRSSTSTCASTLQPSSILRVVCLSLNTLCSSTTTALVTPSHLSLWH
eukprot:1900571-Rhodomonas_salina.1